MPGVTLTGFVPLTLAEVKAELEAEFRSAFGNNVQVQPASINGQAIGIFAEREASLWELAERVYHAAYTLDAVGAALDTRAAMHGVTRLGAEFSTVVQTFNGPNATAIPAGTIFRDPVTLQEWATDVPVTIGPTLTVDVAASADVTGPILGLSGTLTEMVSIISGVTTTNALDAAVGRNIESDAALRLRILSRPEGDSADDIRFAVLALTGVTSCTVFVNDTEATVGGMPPHSVEAVVVGGVVAEIAQAIWNTVGGGIRPFGTGATAAVNVVDTAGDTQSVGFSRPTTVSMFVSVTAQTLADFPTDGETQVILQILDKAGTLLTGQDVIAFQLAQNVEVAGIGTFVLKVGRTSVPTNDIETVTGRELAVFDSSRITPNIAAGSYTAI